MCICIYMHLFIFTNIWVYECLKIYINIFDIEDCWLNDWYVNALNIQWLSCNQFFFIFVFLIVFFCVSLIAVYRDIFTLYIYSGYIHSLYIFEIYSLSIYIRDIFTLYIYSRYIHFRINIQIDLIAKISVKNVE